MGNCLKTQLKVNVDNDNLDILGVIRIKMDLTRITAIEEPIINSGADSMVEVIDADTKTVLVQKQLINNALDVETWQSFIGKNIDYRIHNKYSTLTRFIIQWWGYTGGLRGSMNIDDLKYVTGLTELRIYQNVGVLKLGDFNDIPSWASANTLAHIEISSTDANNHITGDFDALITNLEEAIPTLLLPQLKTLNLQARMNLPDGYDRSTLQDKYIAAGVTTCDLWKPQG